MSLRSRVSVVIPTYNRAGYIRQAIDSVLSQTYADPEVIVVDDGSTDDTRVEVAAYGDRVKYIATPHGGIAHARNVGMQHAQGEYLSFLDSDDTYAPHKLELQSRLLDRYRDVGMVYTELSGFDDAGFWDEYHLRTYHSSAYRDPALTYDRIFEASVPLSETGALPESLAREKPDVLGRRAWFGHIFDVYLHQLVVFTNSMMIRRDVIERVGPRAEHIPFWEEVDYALRICRATRVCFADVPTYRLRYHPGQISTTTRHNGKYVWLRKQRGLLRTVKRHALQDAEYYRLHRAGIDARLAGLHRAVAVPMLLFPSGTTSTRRRYAQRARRYLARCSAYGRPAYVLWLMTFTPGPIRRFGVTVIEYCRKLRLTRRLKAALGHA